MAEFFVFRWDYTNWMDRLTPAEVAERVAQNPNFQTKYDARWQTGDIKEVYEDGHLPVGRPIYNNHEFCIKVPSISYANAKKYMDAIIEGTDQIIIRKRRRYRIDWTKVPQAIKDELLANRVITLTNITQLRLVDKTV